MFKYSLLLLIFILASSCASSRPNWQAGLLTEGLELARASEYEKAQDIFETACEQQIPGACLSLGLAEDLNPLHALRVRQLATDERHTVIELQNKLDVDLKVLVWNQDKLQLLAPSQVHRENLIMGEGQSVQRISISGLRPATEYRIDFYTKNDQLLDSRYFRSLKTEGIELKAILGVSDFDEADVAFNLSSSLLGASARRLIPVYTLVAPSLKLDSISKGESGSYRLRLRGSDFYFIDNSAINEKLENWLLDSMAKTRRSVVLVGKVSWVSKEVKSFPTLFQKIKKQVRAPVLLISMSEAKSEIIDHTAFTYPSYEIKVNPDEPEQMLWLKNQLGQLQMKWSGASYKVKIK